MNDFFRPDKPKKEQLKDFILGRRWTKTHEVLEWGLKHHHNRALRDAQDLCEEGAFRRMTEAEHDHFFKGCKENAWVANDFKIYEREAA